MLYALLASQAEFTKSHAVEQPRVLTTCFCPLSCHAAVPCRLVIMGFDWVGPDLVFGGMTTLFIITGILSLRDAAAGELQHYTCPAAAVLLHNSPTGTHTCAASCAHDDHCD